MKIEYAVYRVGRDSPTKTFPTFEEAEKYIKNACGAGIMGTVQFYIQKLYTNKD